MKKIPKTLDKAIKMYSAESVKKYNNFSIIINLISIPPTYQKFQWTYIIYDEFGDYIKNGNLNNSCRSMNECYQLMYRLVGNKKWLFNNINLN